VEETTFNILNITAEAYDWVHRGTLRQWEEQCQGYTISTSYPPEFWTGSADFTEPPVDSCTFWFHLKHDKNQIIGFDWHAKTPNIVKTISGSLQTSTPINLSYITSQKQLADYFAASKKASNKRKEPLSTPTMFTRVMEFLTKERL
jgi:hypothetical protein